MIDFTFTSTMTDEQCALMRKTLEHILGNLSEYDQCVWGAIKDDGAVYQQKVHRGEDFTAPVCGTVYCFAGHAAVTISGAHPEWFVDGNQNVTFRAVEDPETGRVRNVSYYARDLLGLSESQANLLFHPMNTLENVVDICYTLSGGRVDLRTEAAQVGFGERSPSTTA